MAAEELLEEGLGGCGCDGGERGVVHEVERGRRGGAELGVDLARGFVDVFFLAGIPEEGVQGLGREEHGGREGRGVAGVVSDALDEGRGWEKEAFCVAAGAALEGRGLEGDAMGRGT